MPASRRGDIATSWNVASGSSLGFALDKRELAKYSYAPQTWVNIEAEQNGLRQLALELLQAKRSMPITPFQPSPSANKFPPPPSASH